VDVLVVYGFHPEEPLAEKVGENLRGWKQEKVKAVRFRPSFMPDNVHHLPEKERFRITYDGKRELRDKIKNDYGKVGCILDLHETPVTIMHERPQYEIVFPGWNHRLRETFETFAKGYESPVWIVGEVPKGFPGFHAAAVEYYSRIRVDDRTKKITKEQGTKFAKDVIDHLISHYLT
jgi:hypothetical protein